MQHIYIVLKIRQLAHRVLGTSLLQMLNVSVSDRKQDRSMRLQRLEDVKEEHLIE